MVVPSNCAWGVRSLESIRTEDRCNHPGILSNYGGELWLLQMSYGCGLELLQKKIWVCLKIVHPYTQWLMIIIPTKWLQLGVYPIFRHTHITHFICGSNGTRSWVAMAKNPLPLGTGQAFPTWKLCRRTHVWTPASETLNAHLWSNHRNSE